MKLIFFKNFKQKNLHKITTIFWSIFSFKFQFGRSNPTLINTEQAKYKEKFSRVNSPTKGAQEQNLARLWSMAAYTIKAMLTPKII